VPFWLFLFRRRFNRDWLIKPLVLNNHHVPIKFPLHGNAVNGIIVLIEWITPFVPFKKTCYRIYHGSPRRMIRVEAGAIQRVGGTHIWHISHQLRTALTYMAVRSIFAHSHLDLCLLPTWRAFELVSHIDSPFNLCPRDLVPPTYGQLWDYSRRLLRFSWV